MYAPNPVSHLMYTDPPPVGDVGVVVAMPGFPERHYLPGPGGGLLYVRWATCGTRGVAPQDVERV